MTTSADAAATALDTGSTHTVVTIAMATTVLASAVIATTVKANLLLLLILPQHLLPC